MRRYGRQIGQMVQCPLLMVGMFKKLLLLSVQLLNLLLLTGGANHWRRKV